MSLVLREEGGLWALGAYRVAGATRPETCSTHETRNTHKTLVRKCKLNRSKRRWEENVKMDDATAMRWEGKYWAKRARDTDRRTRY